LKKILVVINKMDESTVNWSKERFIEITGKLLPYLKSIRFNDIIFVPISGFKGINIINRIPPEICSWYNGPSLLEALDELDPIKRNEKGPLRVTVLDRYREQGNIYLLGKIESGILKQGDSYLLMPSKQQLEVTKISVGKKNLLIAKPGENVLLTIKGIEEGLIHKGFVLCDLNKPTEIVSLNNEMVAKLMVLNLPPRFLFSKAFKPVIHIHNVVDECTVAQILAVIDPTTEEIIEKSPQFVSNQKMIYVHLKTSKQICFDTFKTVPQLGRLTLRYDGKTIAFGNVMAVGAPKKK